jgi:hypothetical protein
MHQQKLSTNNTHAYIQLHSKFHVSDITMCGLLTIDDDAALISRVHIRLQEQEPQHPERHAQNNRDASKSAPCLAVTALSPRAAMRILWLTVL